MSSMPGKRFATFVLTTLIVISCSVELVRSQALQFDSLETFIFRSAQTTDCWGYTGTDGQEYAIVGIDAGIVFINTTTLQIIDTVTGSGCGTQDMKTMGNYCYAVSGCGTGLRVINMKFLPDSVHLVGIFPMGNQGLMSSHNMSIDTVTGFLYTNGNSILETVFYHDIRNPELPVYSGSIGTVSLHDLFVHGDTAYVAEGSVGTFSIWDMSNKQAPQMLVRVAIPNGGFVHNIWPSDDRRHVITTEETFGQTVKIWNIEDMSNVTLVGEYLGPNGLAHNAHIEGDYLYLSHYEAGVRQIDISNPAQPIEVAFFDTWPQSDNPGFGGNWGVFPHTASDLVYASDRSGKLFVLQSPISKILPAAQQFNMGGEVMSNVLENIPTFHWTFNDTIGSQAAYELEIGTDVDWTVAEMLATGQVSTSDTSVKYAGSPLIDGVRYFVRIRVNNGVAWGDWRRAIFRMNSIPTVPALSFPINSFEVVPANLQLQLTNSVDAESDQLTYDYELYSDASLTTLIESQTGLSEQSGVTLSDIIMPLATGNQFWWRARVFDGFEFSAWSSAATFVTRSSRTFSVPVDFASISEGISNSQYGDTLVVAPGLYVDNLLFGSKIFTIISSGGASQTELRPLDPLTPLIRIVSGDSVTTLSGFTMGVNNSRTMIQVDPGADVVLRNNVFRDFPVFSFMINIGNADVTLEQNLFVNNQSEFCVVDLGTQSNIRVINNTFDSNRGAMGSSSAGAVFMNNIVTNTTGPAVNGVFATLDYNDFWNNATDYIGVAPGINDIHLDPLFVSPTAGDYSLQPLSPCIDAGNPDTLFNDPDGTRGDMGAFSPGVITDVDDDSGELPSDFTLAQNYPNPFNPSTTIEFTLAVRSHVTIKLFNLLGQRVRILQDRELPAGSHNITWDGSDEGGRFVPSGVYFYRMVAGEFAQTRKMVLLK